MKKTINVTMEVDVSDLSAKDLRENAKLCECKISDLPVVADLTPGTIADCVVGSLEVNEELFAGSHMYIRVTGARVIAASYKELEP